MKSLVTDKNAIAFLCIIYAVGTAGFLMNIHPDFPLLTPVNLLLSLVVALSFHDRWNGAFVAWCVVVGIVGFTVEMVGVATGDIFGTYVYGRTLGWKVQETPLSISVNWLLTTYCCSVMVSYAAGNWHWLVKSIVAALLMVSLDVLIEPIAMKTDMWNWANQTIPFQNYVGWFLTALPLQVLFFLLIRSVKNKVAVVVLVLQFAFFLILNRFMN